MNLEVLGFWKCPWQLPKAVKAVPRSTRKLERKVREFSYLIPAASCARYPGGLPNSDEELKLPNHCQPSQRIEQSPVGAVLYRGYPLLEDKIEESIEVLAWSELRYQNPGNRQQDRKPAAPRCLSP